MDVLQNKHVHKWYIDAIRDMYDGVVAILRTIEREANTFAITIGLHQGFVLSSFLFFSYKLSF